MRWRTSRWPIAAWPRRPPSRRLFRPGGRHPPTTRPGSCGPWLATIARRAAIDIHRRESRRRHESLDATPSTDPALVSLPPSIERVYDIWEVRQALNQLAPEEATLVRLQHLEGLTHTEIADRLGIPVGTVKSRTYRAHRRLAGLLGHLRDDPKRTDSVEPT